MQEAAGPDMEALRFGVRLSSLQTERTGKASLGAIPEVGDHCHLEGDKSQSA